ncbi:MULTISPECIES: hypothetical protein, partial [unclassified Okeania]|uniref:hypothetical protein n=1 Tax=unclassified Okeania TaxID=2634635 RepID=UPI00257F932B
QVKILLELFRPGYQTKPHFSVITKIDYPTVSDEKIFSIFMDIEVEGKIRATRQLKTQTM